MGFQKQNHLIPDGIIGIRTTERYRSSMARAKEQHTEKVFALPGGIEQWYGTSLTTIAKNYQGNPYDTPLQGADGTTRVSKTGEYTIKDNFSGIPFKSEKKPLVCIDLITRSLQQIGCLDMRDFQNFVGNDQYATRRVTEFEKYVQARSDRYDTYAIGASIDYSKSTPDVPKLSGVQV
jgi:hypothetical protein